MGVSAWTERISDEKAATRVVCRLMTVTQPRKRIHEDEEGGRKVERVGLDGEAGLYTPYLCVIYITVVPPEANGTRCKAVLWNPVEAITARVALVSTIPREDSLLC